LFGFQAERVGGLQQGQEEALFGWSGGRLVL